MSKSCMNLCSIPPSSAGTRIVSMLIPRITRPRSLCVLYRRIRSGVSSRHGKQAEYQKLSRTTLPLCSERLGEAAQEHALTVRQMAGRGGQGALHGELHVRRRELAQPADGVAGALLDRPGVRHLVVVASEDDDHLVQVEIGHLHDVHQVT